MQSMTAFYADRPAVSVPPSPSAPRLVPQPGWPIDLRMRTLGQGEGIILVSFALGRLTTLTRAELEVARLANAGHSNGLIARARGTSRYTVARQMSNVLLKLGIGARLGLATIAELSAWSPSGSGNRVHQGTPADSLLTANGPEVESREVTRIWRDIASGHWTTLAGADADGMRRAVMSRDSAGPIHWRMLSRVHREVLELVAGGFAQKAIAMKLGLAPTTVSAMLAAARRRLGFGSLGQLLRAYCAFRDVIDCSAGPSSIQMQP
jgi:DNA-binding NarL/FixJ family response regulator